MEGIRRVNKINNEDILENIKEDRTILHIIKKRKGHLDSAFTEKSRLLAVVLEQFVLHEDYTQFVK